MENRNSNNSRKMEEGFEEVGFPVHSQVRKIKQESDKTTDWLPGNPEMRTPVFKEITRQVSRSPLGILAGRSPSATLKI